MYKSISHYINLPHITYPFEILYLQKFATSKQGTSKLNNENLKVYPTFIQKNT